MKSSQLLSLWGLKWNPFSSQLPQDALIADKKAEHFFWRCEELLKDGGFAMITGDPGLGKSVTLRMLHQRLTKVEDVVVAEITRPQSSLWEFYSELGTTFGIELRMNNRWSGYKALRERWINHIETTMCCPVLLIDEAQELSLKVLSEIRLMSSMCFDSKNILTIVLCGDSRLPDKFRSRELIPLGSRIKARLLLTPYTKDELLHLLKESMRLAGSVHLMSSALMDTIVEHSASNPRLMMNMANELLLAGAKKELAQLEEGLFFDCFKPEASPKRKRR